MNFSFSAINNLARQSVKGRRGAAIPHRRGGPGAINLMSKKQNMPLAPKLVSESSVDETEESKSMTQASP